MTRTIPKALMLSVVVFWAGCGSDGSSNPMGEGGGGNGGGGGGGGGGSGGQDAAAPDTGASDVVKPDSSAIDTGTAVDSVVDSVAPPPDAPAGWRLVWNDEFNGAADSAPDSSKWGYDVGGNGWGNNELQFYTNRRENSAMDGNGNLVIHTLKETYMGRNYTSARLLTRGKLEQTYGRYETRAKLPAGRGLWPAFWALGADIGTVSWPTCGEIDIMEHVGRQPTVNYGTLHGPGYSGAGGVGAQYTLPGGAVFSADFHTFAVEWEQNVVRFYVDGSLYKTTTPANLPAGTRWVFDHPFFLLLNVAVGGPFPGPPDATTVFPQELIVDYVRVYSR